MEAGRAGEVSTQTYARNGYGGTIANRGGTAPHKPLLSQINGETVMANERKFWYNCSNRISETALSVPPLNAASNHQEGIGF